MKRVICLLFALIMVILMASCNAFTPPPTKNAEQSIKLFNNTKLNGINFDPESLFIRKDLGGYIVYTKQNTTVADEIEHFKQAIDDINKDALSEGDYQAGYRILYVHEDSFKQKSVDVSVRVEFTNINHTGGDVTVKTLKEYLEQSDIESGQMNYNFIDANNKQKTSIADIKDLNGIYIAECNNVVNHAQISVEGFYIVAYYVENTDNTVITVVKDSISSSTAHFYFVFKKQDFPIWTVFLGSGLLIVLVIATVIKFSKKRK